MYLSKKELKDIMNILIKELDDNASSNDASIIHKRIKKLCNNINVKIDSNIEGSILRWTTSNNKQNKEYIESISSLLDGKIKLWTNDFWEFIGGKDMPNTTTTNNKEYGYLWDSWRTEKLLSILQYMDQETGGLSGVKKELGNYLDKMNRISYEEVDLWYSLNKNKKIDGPINDFILQYNDTHIKNTYKKLQYLVLFKDEKDNPIIKTTLDVLLSSPFRNKAITLCVKNKIKVLDTNEEVLMLETNSNIIYEEKIAINPTFFVHNYSVSPNEANEYIKRLSKILDNSSLILYELKEDVKNDLFKNNNSYLITIKSYNHEKLILFKNKIIDYYKYSANIMLDKNSEYSINKKGKEISNSNLDIINEYIDLLEKNIHHIKLNEELTANKKHATKLKI